MDVTYMMIGVDGQQYGPVTLEQMQGWIRESRVTAGTQILRSDINSWLPAAQYVELGLSQPLAMAASAPPPLTTTNPTAVLANADLTKRIKSAAGWFFFIGGVSLVNSIVVMTGNTWRFAVGLGITDVIAIFSAGLGSMGMTIGLLLNLLVLAVFVVMGIFARKGHSWAFIVGMVCYALDAGIFVILGFQVGNIVFHGIALVFIFLGLQANIKLNSMRRGTVA